MKSIAVLMVLVFSLSAYADANLFVVPYRDWGFSFQTPALAKYKADANKDEYQFSGNSDDGFNVSIFVEPAAGKGKTKAQCKAFYWEKMKKNPKIKKDSVEFLTGKKFDAVSYLIAVEFKGREIQFLHTNYYAYHDNSCIDVHASTILAGKKDFEKLLAFTKSLKIIGG